MILYCNKYKYNLLPIRSNTFPFVSILTSYFIPRSCTHIDFCFESNKGFFHEHHPKRTILGNIIIIISHWSVPLYSFCIIFGHCPKFGLRFHKIQGLDVYETTSSIVTNFAFQYYDLYRLPSLYTLRTIPTRLDIVWCILYCTIPRTIWLYVRRRRRKTRTLRSLFLCILL